MVLWHRRIGSGGRQNHVIGFRKKYAPSEKKIGENDLVTVDLSPQIDSCWGDYARSFVIANGWVINKVSADVPQSIKQMLEGINAEKILHKKLQDIATPDMTFEELYFAMNRLIEETGYVNLDFRGNLGHSIEKDKDKRIYIENGNKAKLSGVNLFTFEPHIKVKNGNFGYKMEDVYYFYRGKLKKM